MKWAALVLVVFAAAHPISAAAEGTAKEMLAFYDTGEPIKKSFSMAFFAGAYNGMNWISINQVDEGKLPFICPPNDLKITGDQVVAMVRTLVAKVPALNDAPAALVVYHAAVWTFPCPGNEKSPFVQAG